jgi:hypothetical protein
MSLHSKEAAIHTNITRMKEQNHFLTRVAKNHLFLLVALHNKNIGKLIEELPYI